MKFEPLLPPGFEDREAMRRKAVEMRLAGHSLSQIAKALGFKTGGSTLWKWLRDVPPPEWTKRPRAKDDLREKAITLRKEGKSYREISEALGVSKSSCSLWLRDVPLTEDQRKRLEELRRTNGQKRADANRALAEIRRIRIANQATAEIADVSEGELFIAGVVAYWAEGSKAKPWYKTGRITFMNSDPTMILLFLRWLDLLGVPRSDLTFRVSIHESADVEAALAYWGEVVGGAPDDFGKTTLKHHNPKTRRRNTGADYHGCLVVRVRRSSSLYWRIEGWYRGLIARLGLVGDDADHQQLALGFAEEM